MKTTKKLFGLMLIFPLSLLANATMAQSATHSSTADSSKAALMIIIVAAVVLAIMNLKHSLKNLYTNLFAKRK
jgi:hypothetical protein